MAYLILGLVVFLGVHSVRIVAEDWRTQTRARVGENTFKGVYSVLSLLGFALIVWGFGVARETPVQVWSPPIGMRHAASLLTLIAFVFLAAAYVPRNAIKARVHHPMVLAVKSWALAHVLANGGSGVGYHLSCGYGQWHRHYHRGRCRGVGRICLLVAWIADRYSPVWLRWPVSG
jgi:uncharacterized membrane protein